jgi:exodeoxyribonuclease V alpha subunit
VKIPLGLLKSKFRKGFKLDDKDREYLSSRGQDMVMLHARDFISKRLAPAQIPNDGKQTPFKGHPVFKAQHATATCCRGCLLKWYKIPKGRELTGKEIDGVAAVILEWLVLQGK